VPSHGQRLELLVQTVLPLEASLTEDSLQTLLDLLKHLLALDGQPPIFASPFNARVEHPQPRATRRERLSEDYQHVVRAHRLTTECMAIDDRLKLPPVPVEVRIGVLQDGQRLLELQPSKGIHLVQATGIALNVRPWGTAHPLLDRFHQPRLRRVEGVEQRS